MTASDEENLEEYVDVNPEQLQQDEYVAVEPSQLEVRVGWEGAERVVTIRPVVVLSLTQY